MVNEVANNVENGLSYQDAARRAGVGKSTFFAWKVKGEMAKTGIYKEFLDAITTAETRLKQRMLDVIINAATTPQVKSKITRRKNRDVVVSEDVQKEQLPSSWNAAAFLLERRYPHEFGKNVIEHKGEPDHAPRTIHVLWGKEAETKDDEPDNKDKQPENNNAKEDETSGTT